MEKNPSASVFASSPATVVMGVPGVGEHVVPLEDLVQDDAIQETTESEAHDERRGSPGL